MKQVQKNFFISYLLSDQVWWCNIKRFLSYSKTYTCKFMQANSWHHKLFHFHLFFWIWKVCKGRGKITKKWIPRERKGPFRWNKKHFSVFQRLSFGEKIKIWKKIADTSFKTVVWNNVISLRIIHNKRITFFVILCVWWLGESCHFLFFVLACLWF